MDYNNNISMENATLKEKVAQLDNKIISLLTDEGVVKKVESNFNEGKYTPEEIRELRAIYLSHGVELPAFLVRITN